jgi:exodeoxyribonuclease VIII
MNQVETARAAVAAGADYWAQAGFVHSSHMGALLRSPAHYAAELAGHKTTPALLFGQAVHAAILEPQVYAANFVTADIDRRTNAGKAMAAEYAAAGLIVLSLEDGERIAAMRDAVMPVIDQCRREVGFGYGAEMAFEVPAFWNDEMTGAPCAAKADILITEGGGRPIVWDVKSTEDASPRAFERSLWQYGYHRQAAHYAYGFGAVQFGWIAVEKSAPFGVRRYVCGPSKLDAGAAECRAAYENFLEYNMFPDAPRGYPGDVVEL